jgi:hypothetical protein
MTAPQARTAPPIRWTVTWATARRVLAQLRHDPRTVAMMIAVPAVLMILLRYVLDNPLALDPAAGARLVTLVLPRRAAVRPAGHAGPGQQRAAHPET